MTSQHEPPATSNLFNQPPLYGGVNLFQTNPILEGGASGFPDAVRENLDQFGRFWGSFDARELARLANRHLPELERYDARGERSDQVSFHPAYHALMRHSIGAGLHASPWEGESAEQGVRNRARAMRLIMAAQTECGHLSAMTTTNASLASLRHSSSVVAEWAPQILSRTYDRAFRSLGEKRGATVSLAVAERQNGSDPRALLARAERRGDGLYAITGQKWFVSAPMSDAILMLVRLADGEVGCFLVPRHMPDGWVNAIRLERLKDKLGTRADAAAEIEFDGAFGYLIGEPGLGPAVMADTMTYLRLDCGAVAAGLMRGGFAEAVHHARHRANFGVPLIDRTLMQRVLADMALDVAGATALSLRLAEAFDMAGNQPAEAAYVRLMAPVVKYWTTKSAPALLAEAMECVGGNAFSESSTVARAYRDAPAFALWETPGNLLAQEMLRAMRRDDETLQLVLGTIREELGQGARAAVDVLSAAAAVALEDEGAARMLAEQLALTAAAAALRRDHPAAIADAFIETRLGRPWRSTYGMMDARYDCRALLDYLCPA
ncbi:acyl-CoA dehydrogenase family protein [Faunimonas pinastri]|nr:acyl-CoA dehydrogenase family protein [Faunimonas pinastri]